MASTSMTLGPHWEAFIQKQLESGRFSSASEVVRAGLRELEEESSKLEALKEAIRPGLEQAEKGEFVHGFSMRDVVERAAKRNQNAS